MTKFKRGDKVSYFGAVGTIREPKPGGYIVTFPDFAQKKSERKFVYESDLTAVEDDRGVSVWGKK